MTLSSCTLLCPSSLLSASAALLVLSSYYQVTASALNRSKFPWEVPGNTAASIASSTTTSTTSDNVYKAASSVLRRSSSLSPFHQVSLSGESQLAGEPDKSIKRNEAAEQPPTIIEEDIATDLEENLFRLKLRWDIFPAKRWINNTIYYRISSEDYGRREVGLIESAIKTVQFLTCLQFKPWDGDAQKDYLHFMNSTARPGCWSYIGRRGGEQILSLRPPDEKSCHCLCNLGRILHELMHALGFYHEHTRPDRDKYILIRENNVKKGKLKNFEKKTFDTTSADFDYDYNSIMHYGPLFFSKDKRQRKSTIVPLSNEGKPKENIKIGQRTMLSKVDCMKLNQAFGCFDKQQDWQNMKIQALCGVLGY